MKEYLNVLKKERRKMNNYILFLAVFVSSLLITVFLEHKLIPLLSKRAKQPIYAEGPNWHLKKQGTPTMGGVAFTIAISLTLFSSSLFFIYSKSDYNSGIGVLITALFAIGNSLIGVFDDITKLLRKQNAGLTPMQKIVLQSILAVLFLMSRRHFFNDRTAIKFSFGELNLGLLYYPFAIILILGIVNCANLTDGIDGLASSVSAAIGIVFISICADDLVHTSVVAIALVGGMLGFLFFNCNPAKIFMGDTGSLFLGAMAVGLAFSTSNPIIIVLIGSVYVIEGISVILQVIYYKLTRKRLFKMAPLHHHLEKCGIDENKICVAMVILTLLCSSLVPLLFGW